MGQIGSMRIPGMKAESRMCAAITSAKFSHSPGGIGASLLKGRDGSPRSQGGYLCFQISTASTHTYQRWTTGGILIVIPRPSDD
jgi:hypothetical protein